MSSKSSSMICVMVSLAICVVSLTGCGRSGTTGDRLIQDSNKTNIQRLSNLYRFYQAKHGWQGPADEATFKTFIGEQASGTLKRMGIDPSDIDGLFTSERDNEKFEFRWAVGGEERAAESGNAPAVVFEKTGSGGMRMVGFSGAKPKEVDAAEYDKLMKN